MRIGVEFEEAISGSHSRSAYFGTPVSASEMNDYLSLSMDSFMIPGLPKSSLLTTALTGQQGAQATSSYESTNAITFSSPASIPRGVNAGAQMRESYVTFLLEQYNTRRVGMFFRQPTSSMLGLITTRLKRSSRILEFMYLGAKVFETLGGKPEEAAMSSCSPWITRYSNQASNSYDTPNPYPSQQEVEDRLSGLLELVFLSYIVLGTSAGYATLRLALPNFLRLVSDDPRLLVEHERSGLLGVSLPAALTGERLEISRFVLYDVKYSLVLGLPTLAEYDTTGFPIAPGTDITAEWVHGIPVEFILNIAEVHNWRAQRKHVDWQMLEWRTLAWRWSQRDVEAEDSVEMVYRIAIQEAWRHATLIYIYMGMCGVTSYDPRVQASVQQIIKLMGVVGDAHLDAHFSVPSVVAGLAARYELQRALILRKLKSFNGMRLWTLRGRDFAGVLEHLWHGSAVDGAAVGWDDYLQARCKVLPTR
ncbi:unnamed protein product [Rhizoctonia solani]|nr:unnamed protein product [Rhizoctonia solani]CAE6473675.1 unnamed protein product [Rhizoctonia solani]